MDQMAAIKQIFFQECEEQLAELETGLLAIDDGSFDAETVNAVFRAVHSIKGGAGAFALEALVRFAHVFETALDHLRSGTLTPSPDLSKLLLRAADVLADLVRAARDDGSVDPERYRTVSDALGALDPNNDRPSEETESLAFHPMPVECDESDVESVPDERRYIIRFEPHAELYAKANETALILREIARFGEITVTCDTSDLPLLSELEPEGSYLVWTILLETSCDDKAIREVFEFVEWDCDLDIRRDAEICDPDDLDVAAVVSRIQAMLAAEGSNPPATLPATSEPPSRRAHEPAVAGPEKDNPACGKESDTKPEAPATATIRVDLDRVDRLIDLVGELVINQAMLAQRVSEAGLARATGVAAGLDELEQLTREIQDSVMAIRAQPVKSVFQRMPRLVREVAAMTGKSARLVTEGESTEVDKTVIERLSDPLVHMIRNAIDHGLETPDARIVAGKPPEGQVHLSAMHRSGRIVIEVTDDGAGIDRARVKALAAQKGLIPPDAALSDDEIDNLIFLPGFSTASAVSDISGRGVGMDVVRRSIQVLGGRISIASRPGLGSTFTMSLPLTLAVLDGMVVTVAGQTLVVPLTAIVETLQPKAADVHDFGGETRVIAIRDQFVPLIDVGRELACRAEHAEPLACVALLVEADGGTRSALLVDAILGQRQVVIKSLEANYRHVPGIAAATILGDGRVALILDVDAVVASARGGLGAPEPILAKAG